MFYNINYVFRHVCRLQKGHEIIMVKSMTGFGRCEYIDKDIKVTVEVKSVNHRYSEISIRIPKNIYCFENEVRNLVKKYLERGKVDIFISYEDLSENAGEVKYNESLARQYVNLFKDMKEKLGIENDMSASVLLRCQDVLEIQEKETDEDTVWSVIEKAVSSAVENLVRTRIAEGENLRKDILLKLENIQNSVEFIEEKEPELVEEYRKKIEDKVREILADTSVDESRIVAETVLYADKICVDEETVRLKSHVKAMEECLQSDEAIGRKMDFIAQEMNREANTILSKTNDPEVSDYAIAIKTEIEKVREQIQNIE